MQVEEILIDTYKGHSLSAMLFKGSLEINKTLVISSATGVLQGFYKKLAAHFAALGYIVLTFDYYGIGKSGADLKTLKNNKYNLQDWGSIDQAAVVTYAKTTFPKNQLILLTHSVGGQILGFNSNYNSIDKIVMVASQSGYYKYFKGWHIPKMWLFWNFLIPAATPLFGYFPAAKFGLFENLPKHMVYQWASWGRKKDYMMHYYNEAEYYFDKIKAPVFSLSFHADDLAPKKTVDWLTAQYSNARITRYHHPDGGIQPLHFGFFKERFKDPFWTKTHEWILNN